MLFKNEYVHELNSNELRLLLIMKVMANGAESLEVSYKTMNTWMMDKCERTIMRTMDALIEKGYVRKEGLEGPHSNIYYFLK